ncbi:MAG: hypothetical protein JWQ74_1383 [Marmoricola sp.]|nr:hypothetical protein [Marmoricola sp.]
MKTARSIALAVTGAALVLAPVAAHAASTRHVDARGDLQYLIIDSDGNPVDEPAQTSTSTNGDIVAAKITYTSASIGITSRFAGLGKAGHHQQHLFEVHGGKYVRTVLVETGAGYWGGKVFVFDGAGKEVPAKFCAPKHKVDYTADTVTVNIPSSCVKSPASIRAGVGTIVVSADQRKLYYDDAYTTKGSFDAPFTLSPVVKKG